MKSCDSFSSLYDITGLASNKWYKITISAKNLCGNSSESPELADNTMHCPQRVSNVQTDINEANVEVSWDSQNDIDSYEILFKQSDSSWDKITGCDNEDGSNVNGDGRPFCSL